MPKVKITHNRATCIGTGTCASIAEDYWRLETDNKAKLLEGTPKDENFVERELEASDEIYKLLKETETYCPSHSITVEKI